MAPTRASHQPGARPRAGSRLSMTRQKTSTMAAPTPAKTARLTSRTNHPTGTATVKNQLMGREAIRASPPQLVVTRAARRVVLARRREPDRLLRMYRAGSDTPQAVPAAAVHARAQAAIRRGP